MPTVLITPEPFLHQSGPYVDVLREAGFEIRYPQDPHFNRGHASQQQVIQELSGADAVLAGGEVLGKEALAGLPQLRVISRCGVGYDRVDVQAASAGNIAVTITPRALNEAVAEHTFALMLAFARRIVLYDRDVRAGRWPRESLIPLRSMTLGIFGLGRIGRCVATRGAAFKMRILATEKFPQEDFVQQHCIELVDFPTLLSQSDFLSLHCPLTEETRNLLNKDTIAQMKPGSVLINVARGGIVQEQALAEALKSGHLRGAAVDTFDQEPVAADNPLLKLDNVVLTPHRASQDELGLAHMALHAAENIVSLYQGQWPDGAVINNQLKDRWKWEISR